MTAMISILRCILFFLLAPAFAIVVQAAGAVQDDFRIVDAGFRVETVTLDKLDGGICNYDSNGALLQQSRSLDGKHADDDEIGQYGELERSGAAQPFVSFFAELVAAKRLDDAGEGMVKLFHHTDNAGGAAINKSGVLEGSKTPGLWRPWRTGDVYLTTKPELNTFERLFYGLSKSKTNAVVPVTVPKSSVGKGALDGVKRKM